MYAHLVTGKYSKISQCYDVRTPRNKRVCYDVRTPRNKRVCYNVRTPRNWLRAYKLDSYVERSVSCITARPPTLLLYLQKLYTPPPHISTRVYNVPL